MLYVYCPRASNGAKELVEALGGSRLRNFDGMDFWRKRQKINIKEGDTIVCWGNPLPEFEGVKLLNAGGKYVSKAEEVKLLTEAKVPTVQIVKALPAGANAGEWLGRKNNHVGGLDLLKPVGRPDFYSKKLDIAKEYRIHSFDGRSIRAGVKVPRIANPHPWIRSYDAGWKIDYDKFESNEAMRKIAHKAVKALGLTFAAVDIGERPDGSLIVFEVNRAPGIEGNSVAKYANAIKRYLEEGPKEEKAKGKAGGVKAEKVQEEQAPQVVAAPPQPANVYPGGFRDPIPGEIPNVIKEYFVAHAGPVDWNGKKWTKYAGKIVVRNLNAAGW